MAKPKGKTVFVCGDCGNESLQWRGRCSSCGAWNSYAEFKTGGSSNSQTAWLGPGQEEPTQLSTIVVEESNRLVLPFGEVNRVLGGGVVAGSVVLLAGDPGIGKSTLLLQIADAASKARGKVLYVSGEESTTQIKMRADRLGISGDGLFLFGATDVGSILSQLDAQKPSLAVVDSIQTTYASDVPSGSGSATQVRECTLRLTRWAKATMTPMFLSGHVTKGGEVAGPKVLEHMVDVVLYLEGESLGLLRLLRGVKNRFGSTNEVGVFEMKGSGLVEVEDPSKAFLSEHRDGAIGSAIVPTLEGSRPMLVEIQALTNPSVLPSPRRAANGVDFNRVLLVGAVLSRRTGFSVSNQDVLVNVAGGLHIEEPSADLGIALAIASSLRNMPITASTTVIGEIGLGGEIRQVPQLERRVAEVARLGFRRCLVPSSSERKNNRDDKLELVPVSTLAEAISFGLDRKQRKVPVGGQEPDAFDSLGQ